MKNINIIYYLLILSVLISCKSENENFKILNLNSTYRYLDHYTPKGPNFPGRIEYLKHLRETGERDEKLMEKKKYIDARFLDLDFDILNTTGENIEAASIIANISLYFKSKTITYSLPERQFQFNHDKIWESESTLPFNTTYIFNDLENYDYSIFEHKPEKTIMTLYINAVNSVGFDNRQSGDLIYSEEIILNDWK